MVTVPTFAPVDPGATVAIFTLEGLAMYHKTRWDDGEQRLFYGRVDRTTWSFFHQWQKDEPRRVGPLYATKTELLADATRYATDYGF